MPALPLWGVIIVVLSVASIIIGLLFCLFKCRRFPRSTVDPAEYTHKKQGFPTIVSEAVSNSTQEKTICPTTTTTTTSNTQPFTPTTTTTSSSSSSSSPSSSSCSILPSSAHAYSGESLSEKHHEFDNSKGTPISHHHHHQEDQKTDNFHISLPLPPPSTSFFADKMELNSDEATKMFELYMSSSDKKAHANQNEFVSIDLTGTNQPDDHKPAFYDTISNLQHKATSTIRSTLRQSLRRQKSSAKKTSVQQVFGPATIPTATMTNTTTVSKKMDDNFADDRLPASPPPQFEPTSTILSTTVPDVSSPPSPPTSKSNDCNDDYSLSPPIQEDKAGITLSSSPFHQWDEEADNQNSSNRTSLTTPRVSAEVSFGVDSTRTVKGRHLFNYDLDTMFAWPSGDSGDEDDDDDDISVAATRVTDDDHHTSIDSVLQADNNDDKISITSGSVHRLVRDSTVVDSDHCSLAARSVCNSVRPSLHEMASWWSNDNESIHQDSGVSNTNGSVQDHDQPLSPLVSPSSDTPIVQNPPQQSISISKAMASYSSSSPTSTFSRTTLKKFRAALANEEDFDDQDSDQDNDNNDDNDDNDDNDNSNNNNAKLPPPPPTTTTTTTTTISESQRVTEESSIKYAVPDDELAPIAIPTFTKANTSTIPTAPSSPSSSTHSPPASPSKTVYENDSAQSSIKSRPVSINSTVSSQSQREIVPSSPVAAVASVRSNVRNSTISVGGGNNNNNNNNVDSVRRVLQGTWNTHRYSDHGSIASSRSNLSQGMSPPGSVNPRQLNQHLASLSLQSSNGRHPIRPGLPTGFMNEDLLVPGGLGTTIMGPQPTVSFSSSTVRTMIPEDEPIERHVGQKKVTLQPQQQKQKPAPPKQKQKKEAVGVKSSTVAARSSAKDQQKQQQQSFGTMRTGRQQRGTMPWNADTSSKAKTGEKTPAQRERDRYLQSLKG